MKHNITSSCLTTAKSWLGKSVLLSLLVLCTASAYAKTINCPDPVNFHFIYKKFPYRAYFEDFEGWKNIGSVDLLTEKMWGTDMQLKNIVVISGTNVICNYFYPANGAPYKELVSFEYYAKNIKPRHAESWRKLGDVYEVGDVSVCIIGKGNCELVTE